MSMTQTSHSKCLVFAPGREQQGNLADCVGWREEVDGGRKERPGCQKYPLKKVSLKGSSARKKKIKGRNQEQIYCWLWEGHCFHMSYFPGDVPILWTEMGHKGDFQELLSLVLRGSWQAAGFWLTQEQPWNEAKICPIAHNLWDGENAAAHAYGSPRSAVHQHCSWPQCKTHAGMSYFPWAHLPSSFHRLWRLAWGTLVQISAKDTTSCLFQPPQVLNPFSSCVSECNCIQEKSSPGLFCVIDCLMGLSFLSFWSLYKHTIYTTQAKSHSRHSVCLNCFQDQVIYLQIMLFI